MSRITFKLLALLAFLSVTSAHTIITLPGWRGDNLHSNGSYNIDDYKDNLFPYGMQWAYPCGGMRISQNRTKWPIQGGAIAVQPGWFQGHQTAFFYFNLGEGNVPINYSLPMMPVFQIQGPRNTAYPGDGFCFPQVPLPANYTAKVGDNATIQVVEAAKHGAALYNCVDITFTDNMEEVTPVNSTNCFNSSDISFNTVFATPQQQTGASAMLQGPAMYSLLSTAVLAVAATLFL